MTDPVELHGDSALERFWGKVKKTETCWLWIGAGAKTAKPYGRFWLDGRMVQAHRFAYERLVSPIEDGLYLDHLCRTPACVNPAHLEPVTARENSLRGETVLARNLAKTHCPQGHAYDAANTYWTKPGKKTPYGSRQCRACMRNRKRVAYRRRKHPKETP
jgi:hypothetical protein